MKKGIFHPKNRGKKLLEIDFECFDGDTRKKSPKMQLMHLQLCVVNCHLQLAIIIFATIFDL
jgi:hypothetical protein